MPGIRFALLLVLILAGTACSVKRFAINKLGDALANSGTTFASDDDPDLVRRGALQPEADRKPAGREPAPPRPAVRRGQRVYPVRLRLRAAGRREELEDRDLARADALRVRAGNCICGRATTDCAAWSEAPRVRRAAAERRESGRGAAAKKDVPLLYWTAAAWGAAISVSKDDPELVADQPLVEALIDRALELDEGFDRGAIHSFLISYEPSRPGAGADAAARARKHFERAMELSGGAQASPLVSLAESVSVSNQR